MTTPEFGITASVPSTNGLVRSGDAAPLFLWTENLTLHYGKKPALEDVSLPVLRGTITALIGPSGCGKTSFLCCLNRLTDLIAGCTVTGKVRFGDLDIFDPQTDVLSLRRRVGMIFQKPNPFPFSIRRNLEFPLREHGVRDRTALQQKVETALSDVGLWDEVKDRLDSPAQALSGGQQQRLCLARALALEPAVLLLDEPCSALDPISSGVVEDLIARLRGQFTLIVVTHNLAQARRIADHAALFWVQEGAGRLIEYGPTRQLFEAPQQRLTADYITGMRG
jgi:phosphate transport system ATP-binding protein